jgi:hypothetical protein
MIEKFLGWSLALVCLVSLAYFALIALGLFK